VVTLWVFDFGSIEVFEQWVRDVTLRRAPAHFGAAHVVRMYRRDSVLAQGSPNERRHLTP